METLLAGLAGRAVKFISRPIGESRTWLDMARRNASLALGQRLSAQATQETRVAALQEFLGADAPLGRIECFDVSHTMGEATVASCVVYDRGAMQSSEYRRFNITGVEPGDDYGAMRQVLERRYRKLADGDGKVPDLILIDGGLGQVNAARSALADLGFHTLRLIGVSKGEERKPGLEQLIFADEEVPRRLPPDHPALHLIQQIRDEASFRHHGPPRATRQGAHGFPPRGDRFGRASTTPETPRALRRIAGRARGEHRRYRACRGHQP